MREFEVINTARSGTGSKWQGAYVIVYEPVDGSLRTAPTHCVWMVPNTAREG